ncbi:MAG: trehalose-phosphatase [Planctomycetes bacterium]|nr:trehalose-phosphatase [Planctomycetota bacterium]
MTAKEGIDAALAARLDHLARVPVLLVASDYDGTLAPIVADPQQAHPCRDSVVALRMLAGLEETHVAVISGRALADLHRLGGLPPEVHLVGSHGGEFDQDFAEQLGHVARELLRRVVTQLEEIAATAPGLSVECKPASAALHYRNAQPAAARAALDAVLAGPAALEGVHTRHGKMVVELLLFETDKGDALNRIRRRVGASAVLFVGDDITDEHAFATLSGPDVGIKVGEGDTVAEFRVSGTEDVARLLARLATRREACCDEGSAVEIEHHSLLSDQRAVALLTPRGSIAWMCVPRIDSPALFAELLGGPNAGAFRVYPAGGGEPREQRYLPNSMAVETRWDTCTVTDFFDCSLGRPRQRAGRSDLLRVVRGSGRVVIEFAPRLDFGRAPTRLAAHDSGLRVEGAPDPIGLRAPGVVWQIEQDGMHHTARASVELGPQGLVLDFRHGTASLGDTQRLAADRLAATNAYWSGWAAQLSLPDLERELVLRSALTLKALCHAPTGGIAAAATTSLPEHIGGVRNWDYRFCWLRDAALTARALLLLGSPGEALSLLDWVLEVVESCYDPSSLKPLYGVGGESVPSDAEVRELSGYRGSRPVRIGNSAAHQVQLDVFGAVVDLIHGLLIQEAPLSAKHARLVGAMVEAVAQRWREPDHGIWELRQEPRHHVHSKTMCWLTLDRAVQVARLLEDRDAAEWRALRDEIAADVVEHGFNEQVGAFTSWYGGEHLDAAVLLVGLTGLLPARDPRFVRTVEAIERELRDGPTVYRYRFDDGLTGTEGGFHICASWLVESYLRIGRHEDARRLFAQIAALAGPTGQLSEQVDPATGTALGNVPQAYSHLGLIENAVMLDRAARGTPLT